MFDSNKTWFCKQLRTEDAKQISEQLNIKDGETTEDGLFTLNQVSCLGCCSLAPVMMIKTEDNDETYGNLTKDSVIEILNQIKEKEEKSEGEIIA